MAALGNIFGSRWALPALAQGLTGGMAQGAALRRQEQREDQAAAREDARWNKSYGLDERRLNIAEDQNSQTGYMTSIRTAMDYMQMTGDKNGAMVIYNDAASKYGRPKLTDINPMTKDDWQVHVENGNIFRVSASKGAWELMGRVPGGGGGQKPMGTWFAGSDGQYQYVPLDPSKPFTVPQNYRPLGVGGGEGNSSQNAIADMKLAALKRFLAGTASDAEIQAFDLQPNYVVQAAKLVTEDVRYINASADEKVEVIADIAASLQASGKPAAPPNPQQSPQQPGGAAAGPAGGSMGSIFGAGPSSPMGGGPANRPRINQGPDPNNWQTYWQRVN